MIFIVISCIVALVAFIASWYVYQSKIVQNIKYKLITAFMCFGSGLLLNLIGDSLLGDLGLILVIVSVAYLLKFWIKTRDKMFAL